MQTTSTEARIIRFCNGAARTWDEIVSMLAGCNAGREDLCEADAAKVHAAAHALAVMTREGRMVRECATDPRHDRYCPAK